MSATDHVCRGGSQMTAESREMAAIIDRFPEDIRVRLRDALKRIAEIYVVSGVPMAPLLAVVQPEQQP